MKLRASVSRPTPSLLKDSQMAGSGKNFALHLSRQPGRVGKVTSDSHRKLRVPILIRLSIE